MWPSRARRSIGYRTASTGLNLVTRVELARMEGVPLAPGQLEGPAKGDTSGCAQ
jgi:hypothetical protein